MVAKPRLWFSRSHPLVAKSKRRLRNLVLGLADLTPREVKNGGETWSEGFAGRKRRTRLVEGGEGDEVPLFRCFPLFVAGACARTLPVFLLHQSAQIFHQISSKA